MNRTIYISNAAYLRLRDQQLSVMDPQSNELKGSVPIEDMAILIIDHPQITITHGVIRSLQENNVAIISCDEKHMPYGLMLPLVGYSEQMQAQRYQLAATDALNKNLWKQCVLSKVKNQAKSLEIMGEPKAARKLKGLLNKIKYENQTEVEGYAASVYWRHFLTDFERDQYGAPPNNYLNYGYIVLRSMVARAIVSAGMLPTIGIFHHNKYNPYCLADDIMEPYRPFVDLLVLKLIRKNQNVEQILQQDTRQALLSIATIDTEFDKVTRPLMKGLEITAASLRKCYEGRKKKLVFPSIP